MAPSLSQRAVEDVVNDIQDKFSWDYCMSKSYCKWPVIVGIIILSLILLSIVFCIVRCICCGASCCCGCFSCLNCCFSSRRKKSHQQLPSYPQPSSYFPTQYHERLPPMYNGSQVAQFDTSFKSNAGINEDALPAMPTWETSAHKRVENSVPAYRGGSVEMKPIDADPPYAWAQETHRTPTGYSRTLSQAQNGAAGEYYSNQKMGFHDNGGTRDDFGDNQAYPTYNNHINAFESKPNSTSNEGMRYEPYRSIEYVNTYSGPHIPGNTPRLSQQQSHSNLQSLRKPAAGAWRDL